MRYVLLLFLCLPALAAESEVVAKAIRLAAIAGSKDGRHEKILIDSMGGAEARLLSADTTGIVARLQGGSLNIEWRMLGPRSLFSIGERYLPDDANSRLALALFAIEQCLQPEARRTLQQISTDDAQLREQLLKAWKTLDGSPPKPAIATAQASPAEPSTPSREQRSNRGTSTVTLTQKPGAPASPPIVLVDFGQRTQGPYDDNAVRNDWKGVKWSALYNRSRIVVDDAWPGKQCLEVKYPAGGAGPGETGGQFLITLPPRDEYCLDYYVKFRDGFDFRHGGKLPGLCGGRCNTGGDVPTGDGWSARYMWTKDHGLILYLYHLGQPGKWGDASHCEVEFEYDRWYRLTQRVKVNTPEASDGIVQVWIDGRQVLDLKDVRFRNIEGAKVDHFYFSTFHGGGGPDYAPSRDSYLCFDHFRIADSAEAILAEDLRKTEPLPTETTAEKRKMLPLP